MGRIILKNWGWMTFRQTTIQWTTVCWWRFMKLLWYDRTRLELARLYGFWWNIIDDLTLNEKSLEEISPYAHYQIWCHNKLPKLKKNMGFHLNLDHTFITKVDNRVTRNNRRNLLFTSPRTPPALKILSSWTSNRSSVWLKPYWPISISKSSSTISELNVNKTLVLAYILCLGSKNLPSKCKTKSVYITLFDRVSLSGYISTNSTLPIPVPV